MQANELWRIPIIPGDWAATKVASLFCDDFAHYTDDGEPRVRNGIEERQSCDRQAKLLLADKSRERFCILHDPGSGNGIEASLSGQWWGFTIKDVYEVTKAETEYTNRMKGHHPSLDWWNVILFGGPMPHCVHMSHSQELPIQGLTNKVSKSIPAGLKSGKDEEEAWEMMEGEDIRHGYVDLYELANQSPKSKA